MFRCKIINIFFSFFPFKRWQDFLIRHHIQECPACRNKLASAKKVRVLLIQEGEAENFADLWPGVRKKLTEKEQEERDSFWFRWRWAFRSAGLFAVIAAGILIYTLSIREMGTSMENMAERFQINYIKVENKPARAFLFQPQGSEMIIVWAEKNM
ncbi:MAG: hypothetical protein E3J56_03235 [Candidatus Aminicenantes bacterium]|nr:MAG: hypothetical protein E3J56_03235 [Candidatus Aminicenantes bacterium]